MIVSVSKTQRGSVFADFTLGGIDSKFLMEAAAEVIQEIRGQGWFEQFKSALTRPSECSPPGSDKQEIKKFIRCCARSASDTLEDRFMIVSVILAVLLLRSALTIFVKVRNKLQHHLDLISQSNISARNDSHCVNMNVLQPDPRDEHELGVVPVNRQRSRIHRARFVPPEDEEF